MSRNRKITIAVISVLAVMLTIHLSLNGMPDFSSWNPHNK